MRKRTLILASGSPRRHEILTAAGFPHLVRPSDADETLPAGISPGKAVEVLSARKARAALDEGCADGDVVLAADTVVALGGTILGKPKDTDDARRMLRALSGKEHSVFTGITVTDGTVTVTTHEETVVRMRDISTSELEAYLCTGESLDKAGAYGIQGRAGIFVSGIVGDYQNVVGLPLCLTVSILLEKFGFDIPNSNTD